MYFRYLLLIAATIGPQWLMAQHTYTSVEDIWNFADAHNISIRAAEIEADKAGYAQKQSYSSLLPQIAANGAFTQNLSLPTTLIPAVIFGGPDGTFKAVQFGQKYINNGSITAQMDVLNLQTWFGVQIARHTLELNRAMIANTKKTVYQQLATQYYSYLLMREAGRLAAIGEAISDSVLQTISEKYAVGSVNEANMDAAKINKARAEQASINAKYQMMAAYNNLKSLLGLSLTDTMVLTGTLKNTMSTSVDGTFQGDPFIKQAYYQQQISLSRYKAATNAWLPVVSVLYSNATQQNLNTFDPFNNNTPWYPAQYWTVRANWQLFNGGSKWYQSRGNKLSYQLNTLQYEHAIQQASLADENIRINYRRAKEMLQKAEQVMQWSLDNYQHTSYRYAEGLDPLTTRLNVFADYINYQNQYLNSLSEMLVQMYQLKIRQHSF